MRKADPLDTIMAIGVLLVLIFLVGLVVSLV